MDAHINPKRKKEYVYLLRVLIASLYDRKIPLPPSDIDWKFLFNLVNYNSCVNLFFNGISKLPEKYKPNKQIYNELQNLNNLFLTQDINQMYELSILFDEFEKHGVYFIPLKGYVLKSEYPQSDFRIMTDADILFKEEQIDLVKEINNSLGFKFEHFDNDNQYHFKKEPFIYIEMHTSLVNHRDEKYDYFLDIWEKSHKKENYNYYYEMTKEDYYIFLIEHASNHFKIGGIGLRHLIDIYLFNRKYEKELDYSYLTTEFKKIDLFIFEEKIKNIAVKWFEKQDFSSFSLLEEFILLSSALGRFDVAFANISIEHKHTMEKNNKRPSKFKFLLSQIFPSVEIMKNNYLYLNKIPFLLPISWIQMWANRIFISRNVHFKRGIKSRLNYIDEKGEEYLNNIYNEVGFQEKTSD